MKKTSIILMLLTASFSLFTSCKKDKNETNKCSNPNVSANISGTNYAACNGYATTLELLGYDYFQVTSMIDLNNSLSFAFNTGDLSVIEPGSYTITNGVGPHYPTGDLQVDLVYLGGGKNYLSQSGTLNFTIADGNHYKGTFSASLRNSSPPNDIINVTNGSFDVTYK